MEEQAQNKQIGAIAVHSQYIKDLSLEIPHAPEIFSEIKSAPKIDVHVDVKSEPKGNNTYTSQLSISMNGKVEDKTLFVLELTYAAFAEVNVPAEHLEPVLMIELPRLIFPFARNVVTQCLTEGGLPPRRASLAPTAFSFGGVRNGRIAPAVYLQVCGLTPCGNSSELPLPSVRSANPHGVALPLAGENDSRNLTEGGRIMADQSSPARCAEALAHHTFKSSDFLKGSDFAANRSLGFILDVLSSNDPEGVDAIDSDLRALVNDVADGMNYIASVLEAPADASQKVDSLSPEQSRGLGAIVGLLADTLLLVSAASVKREDARTHLLKNRG